MEQFQITSTPRHLRYVFFVDENYPYEKLFALIHTNQKMWGGRYNPIVPVKNDLISDNWKNILQYYDPDFVFYSNGINPEVIKQLRFFNPCGYYNLDEQPRKEDISGLDGFYLLSEVPAKSKIILTADTWRTESPLLSYYQINFGFETSLIQSEVELSKELECKIVNKDEFKSLNMLIYGLRPINQSHLSKKNLNTVVLRSKNYTGNYQFEIVIAKDKSSNADLLYYWNRMLFEIRNIIYVTVEELYLLSEDEYFGKTLHDMDWGDAILVTSQTLTKDEIQEIINTKLKKANINRRLEASQVENFPFEVAGANGFGRNHGETVAVQTLNSNKGLLYLPKPSFVGKDTSYQKRWIVDVKIKELTENYQNEYKLPFTTETHYIVRGVKGRINRERNVSVIIHNQQTTSETLEINIPVFKHLLRQLISRPVISGEPVDTKYIDIGPHDASNKLSAFLKTFNFDFLTIDDFFTDKFWVEVFEELSTSKKSPGDTISFDKLMTKCKKELARKGIVQLEKGIIVGEKGETYKNEENLELGIKRTIRELCNYHVLLKGFNLKCPECSSRFWYHIKEVGETVNCKGCFEDFQLPVEPKFSYKLNDLIKNNIFELDGSRDGNLAVVRTLATIYNKSRQSFQYSSQMNLYDKYYTNAPWGDIDILCLSDGKFIIGEAKHDSKEFSKEKNKVLKSLVEVAKAIRPDKIILSCYEDSNGKLEKAKQGLKHLFNDWEYQPEIECFVLYAPGDFHLGQHRYFYY